MNRRNSGRRLSALLALAWAGVLHAATPLTPRIDNTLELRMESVERDRGDQATAERSRFLTQWDGRVAWSESSVDAALSGTLTLGAGGATADGVVNESTRLEVSGPTGLSGVRWALTRVAQASATDALSSTDISDRLQQRSVMGGLAGRWRRVGGGRLQTAVTVGALDRDVAREKVAGGNAIWLRELGRGLQWSTDLSNWRFSDDAADRGREISHQHLRLERELRLSRWSIWLGRDGFRPSGGGTQSEMAWGISGRLSLAPTLGLEGYLQRGLVDAGLQLVGRPIEADAGNRSIPDDFLQASSGTSLVKVSGFALQWNPRTELQVEWRAARGTTRELRPSTQVIGGFDRSIMAVSVGYRSPNEGQTALTISRASDEALAASSPNRRRDFLALRHSRVIGPRLAFVVSAEHEKVTNALQDATRFLGSLALRYQL